MRKFVFPIKDKFEERWIYVVLGLLIMLCLGTVYSWSVFRLAVEELYNVGTTQSGLPYMVSLAFYALFMFLAGKYLDKYGPRFLISLGGALVALGWIASSYSPNIYFLTITYGVIMGSGVGIAYGVPIFVVAKWFPDKRGFVVGIVLIGFGLSTFVTSPIASYLQMNFGLGRTFQILGVTFAVIIPLLAYPMRYPSNDEALKKQSVILEQVQNIDTADMIKSKSFKGLYLNFIFGSMMGLMLIGMTNNVGVELIKLSSNKVALLMSLFAIFNAIGRPIFGWITDRLIHKKAMLISYGLSIIASLLMLMAKADSILLYSIAFAIFWFNLGGWLAIAPISTLDLYGTKYYSHNYGVVFTAYGIGAMIGVSVSGLLKDFSQSYYTVFYFVIFVCILGIVSSQGLTSKKAAS